MDHNIADSRFQRMLKRILKPLVRFLLKQGITYTALLEALKSIYVEVVVESNQLATKRMTDSRISLLTGIHRKEVKRLREFLQQEQAIPLGELQASLGAAVMAKWLSDPHYLDAQGRPLAIAKSGEEPSFESLVYSVSKDKHYRSLLDDWLAQGVVSLETQQLHLQQFGFIPSEDEVEKLYFAGKNIGSHIQTVTSNLDATQAPMFERAVFYQGLPETAVAEIEAEAKRRNLETLTYINEMAAKAKRQALAEGESPTGVKLNFHVGAYFYREPTVAAKSEQE